MSILYTLITGVALLVLLRAGWYFLRLSTINKSYYGYVARYFPFIEIVIWGSYLFWAVDLLFSGTAVYLVLVSLMVAILLASLGWFVFRDLFAGMVIKAELSLNPGLYIKTGIANGTIVSLGYTSMDIQTSTGELVKIPYSQLRKYPIWRQAEKGHGKTQSIQIKIPEVHGTSNIQHSLSKKLLELPWVIAGSEIKVAVVRNEECMDIEITFESANEDMLMQTEEILNQYVKEYFPGC
jgi:hypothetical protein